MLPLIAAAAPRATASAALKLTQHAFLAHNCKPNSHLPAIRGRRRWDAAMHIGSACQLVATQQTADSLSIATCAATAHL